MCEVRFDIPDSSVVALGVPREEVGDRLRLLAAMMLYEKDQLSAGAAAELAGVSKPEFLALLQEVGIDAIRQTEQEFDRDLEILRSVD